MSLQPGGTFFSRAWKEYLFGLATAVSFLRAAPVKPHTASFYGMCQWKIGRVCCKAALLTAGFLGNLCRQVQQLKFLTHKEAPFHPAHEVVKRNREIRKGILPVLLQMSLWKSAERARLFTAWEQFQASRGTFNRSLLIELSMNCPDLFLGECTKLDAMTITAWGSHPCAPLTTVSLSAESGMMDRLKSFH